MEQGGKFAEGLGVSAVIVAVALVGCGGDKRAEGGDAARTPQQVIEQLEASGELPKLERLPTVEGMDANGNGVRDDIETHIHRKYTDPAQRRAAMQMARAYQRMLLVDKNDALALDRVSEGGFRAVVCLADTFVGEGTLNSSIVRSEIRALSTNTKDRLQAYLAYNKARSGSVSRLPEGDTCE